MKIIEKIRALALAAFIMASFTAHAEDLPFSTTIDNPLTVLNVIIDKTDKNAVIARSAAILDAKRVAFQQLAERNLTPEQMKDFKLPEDQIISRLVQDFEIADEQISATRYVANFTVRFQKTVNDYLKINTPTPQIVGAKDKTVLVLPYYENIAGKKLLWEDGNPWMTAWKSTPRDTGGINIVLPLGDIDDVGAGDAAAVWSDNYIAIEKLRSNYGADEVLLTVANVSGPQMTVDAHIYKDGRLLHVDSFPTHTVVSGGDASFKTGVDAVLEFLHQPLPSQPETPDPLDQPDQASISPPLLNEGGSGPVLIDAEMNFDSFAKWVEAQKRLAAVAPPIKVEIKSISSGMATFTLGFSGNFTTLKSALAEKNITFSAPTIEVDETALDATSAPQKTIYTLQMAE